MSGMKVANLSLGLSACYQVSLQLLSPTCFSAPARLLPHTHTHTKAGDKSVMTIKKKLGKKVREIYSRAREENDHRQAGTVP